MTVTIQAPAKFDVVATNIKTGQKRVIAEGESEANAEAIVKMAVMRRGVEEEFFSVEPWPGHISHNNSGPSDEP